MRESGFTDESIVAILREQEGGRAPKDVCRRHGISQALSISGSRSSAA
jgi:Transposase